MSEGRDQIQTKRYVYKLKLEWQESKKKEEPEISPEELQTYITELLRAKTEN